MECDRASDYSESSTADYFKNLKLQCDTALGGGATFNGSYSKVKTCTASDGTELVDLTGGVWKIIYSCNTCTSEDIKKEVSDFSESCASQCKKTDYKCSYTNGEWGHSFPLPKVCGATDSTLDGCRTEESSSSVEGSSGSGDEGSSSSAGGEGFSSSYGFDGSSSSGGSGEGDGSSSSGSGTCTGDYCGTGTGDGGGFNMKCCGYGADSLSLGSTHNLRYFGTLEGIVYCSYRYVAVNLPAVFAWSENYRSCCLSENEDGHCGDCKTFPSRYTCDLDGSAVAGKGCKAYPLTERNEEVRVVYSDGSFSYGFVNGDSSYFGRRVLPVNAPSVSEILDMSMKVTLGYPYTEFANIRQAFEFCGISVSSSSTEAGSSSSFDEPESSSSVSTGGYSSGSSGGSESEVFVAGENQVYSPDQVFCDGLQNMEFAKCYSLNPDRGIQHGWINDNAQDSWWWVEVPCDGSVPLIETTSAGCYENRRGPTAIYLPEDCFSGGLDNMEYGKCYSLNPDRGAQHGWINNNAQDSWWWVEVPCEIESPDSDDEFVCPENGIFFKRNEPLETSEDSIEFLDESVVGLYDALGRKQKHRNVFGKRNAFYARKAHRKGRLVREFFGNWSVSFKTVSGYVEAKTELGLKNVHFDCVSQTKTIIVANLYMKTPKDSIHKVIDSDDERLLAHENRHEEIYLLKGNGEWEERISVNSNRLTEKNSCYIVKKTFWPVMEKKYRKMLKMQNAWDDEDKNNVSHARLDIDSLLALQKKKWNAQPCLKENPE